jgi:arylsulfatase A
MIARWPGKIAGGSTSDRVSDFADMFPTFAEVIGAKRRDWLDGVSILPTLLGQQDRQAERKLFYWEAAPQQAIRMGDWKAYRPRLDAPLQLYNLRDDIGETTDLAEAQPDIVARLEQTMRDARVESAEFPLNRDRADRGSKRKKP